MKAALTVIAVTVGAPIALGLLLATVATVWRLLT